MPKEKSKGTGIPNYSDLEKETIITYICERIADGLPWNKALRSPVDGNTYIIDPTSFYKWIRDNLSYANMYKQACEVRHDILAEKALQDAGKTRKGKITKMTPKGVIIEEFDNVPRSRLEFNAVQWYLAKMSPKKYGNTPDASSDHVEQVMFNDID